MQESNRLAEGVAGKFLAVAALAAPLAISQPTGSGAQTMADSHLWISIEVPVEIASDWTVRSDDPTAELVDTFVKIEPTLVLHVTESLTFEAGLKLEPVFDPAGDRFFGDLGLFVAALQIVWEHDGFGIAAGKLTPEFGIGWDRMPGLYGDEMAAGYELAERLGVTLTRTFDLGRMGEHRLSASTFFLDTTVLSESAFTNRGRTSLAAGGPSNTEDLSSFVVSLTGTDVLGSEGLGYHLGFARQDSALPGEVAERGFALALFHEGDLAPELTIATIGECALFDNYASVEGSAATICSAGIELARESWSVTAALGATSIVDPGTGTASSNFFQLSAGHEFVDGVSVQIGWRRLEEDTRVSHTIVLSMNHTIAADLLDRR